MPSAYQIFKNEIFQTIKTTYFIDYELKDGENVLTLITCKCKEEWNSLSEIQKKLYIEKAESSQQKTKKSKPSKYKEDSPVSDVREISSAEDPPTYEQSVVKDNIEEDKEGASSSNKTKKRKSIPKAVKESVWKKYISNTELEGMCFVGCGNEIQINNFEIGHVIAVANGGKNTICNLRPVCSLCNKSMGTTNLEEFITTFGFKESDSYEEEIKTNHKKILKINKLISKNEKAIIKLNDCQVKASAELDEYKTMLEDLKLKIKLKLNEIEKNETNISELEAVLVESKEEKTNIDSQNNEIKMKKQAYVNAKLLEEEKLKEELRKEILLEQKKNALKKQMMEEMGINM